MKTSGRPESTNIEYAPVTTPDPYDYSPGPLSELPYPGGTPNSQQAKARVNENATWTKRSRTKPSNYDVSGY